MKRIHKHRVPSLNQAGDTIVEVMIALAVISSVLVGAFLVTQRSNSAVRSSQEHSEALQQLQGQVELVRASALKQTTDSGGVFIQNFCIDTTTPSNIHPVANTSPAVTLNNLYKVSATYLTTGDKRFVFTANWPRLGGGTNSETLVYRIYPGVLSIDGAAVAPAPAPATPPSLPSAPAPDPVEGAAMLAGANGNARLQPIIPIDSCWKRTSWKDINCWRPTIVNISNNPVGSVRTCTYNWGNNTSSTFVGTAYECQYGSRVEHQYPVLSQPSDNAPYVYDITITNTMTSGFVPAPYTQRIGVPF